MYLSNDSRQIQIYEEMYFFHTNFTLLWLKQILQC